MYCGYIHITGNYNNAKDDKSSPWNRKKLQVLSTTIWFFYTQSQQQLQSLKHSECVSLEYAWVGTLCTRYKTCFHHLRLFFIKKNRRLFFFFFFFPIFFPPSSKCISHTFIKNLNFQKWKKLSTLLYLCFPYFHLIIYFHNFQSTETDAFIHRCL